MYTEDQALFSSRGPIGAIRANVQSNVGIRVTNEDEVPQFLLAHPRSRPWFVFVK